MKRDRGLRLLLAASSLIIAVSACASANRERPYASADENVVTMRVDNDAYAGVHVFALTGAARTQLGFVQGKSQAVIKVPAKLLVAEHSLQIYMRPIGGQVYMLPVVSVSVGQTLALSISNDALYASISIVPPR